MAARSHPSLPEPLAERRHVDDETARHGDERDGRHRSARLTEPEVQIEQRRQAGRSRRRRCPGSAETCPAMQ